MATIKAFRALRPKKELAQKVASLPYDVMNREEAFEMAKNNEYSFLHIDRAEIDLDGNIDIYDEKVYQKARENLVDFYKKGILVREEKEAIYIYREIMDNRSQTGILACVSVDESLDGTIKKHEFTKPDKELDRTKNIEICKANTGTILLTYRNNDNIKALIDNEKNKEPLYDFESEDGIRHTVWKVDDEKTIAAFVGEFDKIDYLYVADGHHRSAAAENVAKKKRKENPDYTGKEEFNFFTAMIAPDDELYIMDYNRVIKDLNGYTKDELIEKIKEKFNVEKVSDRAKPHRKAQFGMFIDNQWYMLDYRGKVNEDNAVQRLDVSLLDREIIAPLFGITNPKADERIDFVGGIRGLEGLEKRVNDDMKIAFALYPTPIEDLFKVADENQIMPAKSTWFEPKVRSGIVVHELEEIK